MGSRVKLCVLVCALALTGCETYVRAERLSDNEYQLVAGRPGGFFAGLPSDAAILKKAAEICTSGYDKLGEDKHVFEGVTVWWLIRCHAAEPQR